MVLFVSCSKADDSEEEISVEPTETIANITVNDRNGATCGLAVEVYIFTSSSWANHENDIDFADQTFQVVGTSEVVLDIPSLFNNTQQETLYFMSFYTQTGVPIYESISLTFTEGSERTGLIIYQLVDFFNFKDC